MRHIFLGVTILLWLSAGQANQFHDQIAVLEKIHPKEWHSQKELFMRLSEALKLKNAPLAAELQAYADYAPGAMVVRKKEILGHLRLGANEVGVDSPYTSSAAPEEVEEVAVAEKVDPVEMDKYLDHLAESKKKKTRRSRRLLSLRCQRRILLAVRGHGGVERGN